MPFADFHGQSIYYVLYERGHPSAPALVLVHGAGGTHLHWPPELRRLPDRTVLAVDLPGHGKSGGVGRRTIGDYAEAILALVDDARVKRAVVCGHSMGGAVAQTFALAYPERTAGVVLVGTGARLRVAPAILDGILADFPKTVQLITEWEFSPDAPERLTRPHAGRMMEVAPEVLRGDFLACDQFDVMSRLKEIRAPALVICGSADKLTPEKYSRHLADQLPQAELLVVSGAGHMVMLEKPQVVTEAVSEFMVHCGPHRPVL
ncbi:MAG: alpha/beta hydrolase [Chloroflexi bacterium]|nr:alpha/beta hydrolase [Chloroflexota bacterium]